MRRRLLFSILGPVSITGDDGAVILVTSPALRVLLTRLLVEPNRDVATDALSDTLWPPGTSPRSANALQAHVTRLRRLIGVERILHTHRAYRVVVGVGELDTETFDAMIDEAGVDSDRGRAAQALSTALGLVRGVPAIDLAGSLEARPHVDRLIERWLYAREELFEARLELGHHDAVVAELVSHTQQFPLRERGRYQLILALHRSGRDAEALRSFHDYRTMLVEDLGIEPGAEIVALERAILQRNR